MVVRQKYWVCVVEYTDAVAAMLAITVKMEVPVGSALYGDFLRDENYVMWPIWKEEPPEDVKAKILSPTWGRNWYLIEVEHDTDTNQCY